MAITPISNTVTQTNPVVDADEDAWGGKNNTLWTQAKGMFDSVVTAVNSLITLAEAALPKTGGTLQGELLVKTDTAPSSAYSAGLRGHPIVSVTANKTLSLADAGTKQVVSGTSAVTITVPPVGTVNLAGHVIPIRNLSTQPVTIGRGSGVSVKMAGSSTNKNWTIAPEGQVVLSNDGGNNWCVSGTGLS